MNDRIAYYTASAVRELERLAIEEYGIAAFELMQRAGTEMFAALNQQGPGVKHLLICCGTGLSGAVRPPFRRLIDAINYSGLPALSQVYAAIPAVCWVRARFIAAALCSLISVCRRQSSNKCRRCSIADNAHTLPYCSAFASQRLISGSTSSGCCARIFSAHSFTFGCR